MRKELISIGRDSGNDLNQVEEGAMPPIDADAHVIECEQTWFYINDKKLRSVLSEINMRGCGTAASLHI